MSLIFRLYFLTVFLTVDHNESFFILSPMLTVALVPLALTSNVLNLYFALSHFSYLFFDHLFCTFHFLLSKCLYVLVFKCPALGRGLHELMEMSVGKREHGAAFKFPTDGFLLQ